ncbi:unnamed protein product, partial [Polarella glacialis]
MAADPDIQLQLLCARPLIMQANNVLSADESAALVYLSRLQHGDFSAGGVSSGEAKKQKCVYSLAGLYRPGADEDKAGNTEQTMEARGLRSLRKVCKLVEDVLQLPMHPEEQ